MKIAICDDDTHLLNEVKLLVQEFASTYGASFEISCYNNSVKFIDVIESGQQFELYILDIVMPNITGMMLAKELREYDESAVLIFLTSSTEYALESYDVEAFGYLIKPVNQDKLFKLLTKAMKVTSQQEQDSILLQSGNKMFHIHKNEIEFVEV